MKTSRNNLTICIDWLKIIFEATDAIQVILNCLQLDECLFEKTSGGMRFKQYDTKYTIGHIVLYGVEEKKDNEECLLELSGQGCQQLEKHLVEHSQNWQTFLSSYFQISYQKTHMTRIDLAIDDRNEQPFFTIEQIRKKCYAGLYRSSNQLVRSYENNQAEVGTAKTVYLGDKTSGVQYRFYDKDKEQADKLKQPLAEIVSWKRTELQFNRDYATSVCQIISNGEEVDQFLFSFIKWHLTFYVDKEKAILWRPWERFLGEVSPKKLSMYPIRNELMDTQLWLEKQVIPAISAFDFLEKYQALGGLKSISEMK